MATSPASPLLIATLLLQSKPQLASLHHVADAITSFLDTSVELPLHKACKFGSLELLSRIWSSTVDLPQGDSSWSVRRLLHSEKFYQQFQFTHSLVEAAKQKDLGMTRWLFERFPACDVRREAVEEAAKAGALEILQYFHENGKNMNSYIDDEGDSDVEQRHVFWGYEDAVLAARAGYSDVVRWLYNFADSHTRCEQKVTRTVIETGCVALIEWLWQRLDAPPHEGMLGAAANGHAQMLELLEYEGCSTNPFAIIVRAAEVGQLNVVRWAFESIRNRPSQPSWEAGLAVHNAVVNGHLEVAKYIYARINDEDESQGKENLAAWKKAVMSVLAPESNCAAISRETVILAAERGFAEAVQWLWTEFGDGLAMEALSVMNDAEMTFACPLDAAASNGHLEIMKYLATIDAEENKNLDIHRFLGECFKPWCRGGHGRGCCLNCGSARAG
ncbi:hypothetical protein PHYPSEUDO_006273 [Phytophthora pseudosyringae]|uniref:Ankyrin repeat-containing domain n=1 Tax=Phytophthora pseudosyringae TaxID=221518 RepID=A0A8T1VM23_9STRA|nr:hypothetical protein PHYPSEUDO_006273 [Phytophthora pseudosyringae]